MKSRYYLFRQGNLVQLDEMTVDQAKEFQGYYCVDMGPDRNSPQVGMWLGGRIRDLSLDKFPTAFRAQLLVLDVP
jgi:hypothetical protein